MSASLISSAVADGTGQGYELSITRTFDAPRELVWRAFTEPAMLKEWMGPRGFQATRVEIPAEAGQRWWLEMTGHVPATQEPVKLRQGGVMKEIRPPELLSYTFAWEDRSSVGLPESPFKENVVTIRLEERGGKTVMHFTQAPFATESERDGHTGGWNSAFDRFAEFMLREQPERKPAADEVPSELHLRRFFAAPRQMVFDAWTKPEMVKEWFGPRCFTIPVCEMEARGGGAIRIDMQTLDGGTVHRLMGRYVEFYPPYRFHFTSGPVDKEGRHIFETWTSVFFEEVEGGTEVVLDVHVTKTTPEAAMYLKGMREGWSQSLDKLEEFVGARQ
ncbi:MAG TPA: SRPBCC domain-containing protein [Acidobacteriaceae bacterium]|nr:SRPBCC domain-containing protein [Acidobacteriaceae bacterium]